LLHMVQDSDENTTSSSLASRSALLTSAIERSVVEFLLASGPQVGAMSAREIAQAVGTSDATVIRTARSLGFAGFRDLRRFVASQSTEVPIEERLRKSLDAVEDPDAELRANIERQGGALMTMIERIPESEFREANQIIERAPYVWWSGVGPSAFLAGYGAFLFRRLGKDSGALTHAGFDGADELLSVKSGHAIIVLAYGRLHRHVRVLLERAEEVGSEVIFVTDSVSLSAEWRISVRLLSGRGRQGMFASHATTIVLIEALALSMAANQPSQAQASVEQLNTLRGKIAGRPLSVDP
jgi:DNA-binding MurR/RpiR family transcriptional regulator